MTSITASLCAIGSLAGNFTPTTTGSKAGSQDVVNNIIYSLQPSVHLSPDVYLPMSLCRLSFLHPSFAATSFLQVLCVECLLQPLAQTPCSNWYQAMLLLCARGRSFACTTFTARRMLKLQGLTRMDHTSTHGHRLDDSMGSTLPALVTLVK